MIEVKPFVYVRCGLTQHIDITSEKPFVGSEPLYAQPTIDALQARIVELEKAVEPFAKVTLTSSGRIPVERLSFANWHVLTKAYKKSAIAKERSDG
ncbi:MAG: hypothetical protein ACRDAM_21730 [Casimicrobium sp.]